MIDKSPEYGEQKAFALGVSVFWAVKALTQHGPSAASSRHGRRSPTGAGPLSYPVPV